MSEKQFLFSELPLALQSTIDASFWGYSREKYAPSMLISRRDVREALEVIAEFDFEAPGVAEVPGDETPQAQQEAIEWGIRHFPRLKVSLKSHSNHTIVRKSCANIVVDRKIAIWYLMII